MINGHSVTFDVENSDASDPHHAPFDEALVEKILNGATLSRRVRRISIFLRRFLIFQGLQ